MFVYVCVCRRSRARWLISCVQNVLHVPPADDAHGDGVVVGSDDGRLVGEDDLPRLDVPLGHHVAAHRLRLPCTVCVIIYCTLSKETVSRDENSLTKPFKLPI